MNWSNILGVLVVLAIADALGILFWYACSWPRSQVLGPALVRGPANGKRIALTFDDGPSSPYTEQILNILHDYGVRATFFLCGKDVQQHPEITRRIHTEGHSLGNHTWSHPYLYFMSRSDIAREIGQTQDAIQKATGHIPRLFRPPYGGRWFGLYPFLREREMRLVQWSVNGHDWEVNTDSIIASVCAGLSPGAVILLHDGWQAPGGYLHWRLTRGSPARAQEKLSESHPATVQALPAIIDYARANGFEFVPIEDFSSA